MDFSCCESNWKKGHPCARNCGGITWTAVNYQDRLVMGIHGVCEDFEWEQWDWSDSMFVKVTSSHFWDCREVIEVW